MNTSITTCFYMRHKLYKAASQIIQEQKLSDEIEIDSQYLSRLRNKWFNTKR